MNVEMWAGVVALVVVPVLVVSVAGNVSRAAPRMAERARSSHGRRALDACIDELTGLVPAALIVLAGVTATVALCWVLGLGAHAVQGSVDWPVFRWFERHQNEGWTDVWWKLTNIGSPMVTQDLAVVGAVVLTFVWRRRIWWLPAVALFLGYVIEKYGQIVLKLVVDRGHPPTTLGTWPSGGCARVIIIYGLIVYLGIRVLSPRSRLAWVAGAGFVSLALTVQAYARLNNLEHWFTDVLGGIVYGTAILAVMVASAEVVQHGRSRTELGRRHSEGVRVRPVPETAVLSATGGNDRD